MTRIKVTDFHIINGERRQARRCMVTLAVKPFVKEGIDVTVISDDILFGAHGDNVSVTVPFTDDVSRRISAWDAEVTIEPFEFDLDIPEWARRWS